MKRVAQLLQTHDYRQVLVRLWVLGLNGPRLNDWEQSRGDTQTQRRAKSQFLAALQNDATPTVELISASPLALVQALDEFVAAQRARSSPALRPSNKTLPVQEEGNGYWVVPVLLNARRLASLTRQAGNLSTWFRHHAVLPAKTAHGLRVKLSFSQSVVDDHLDQLWQAENPTLKVWIGHFNDTADVVWDRSGSEAGNWRAQQVAPHDVRLASLLAAISAATDAGAQIIVFPEFTLDLAQRNALISHLQRKTWPSLVLLVAGSFHEPAAQAAFNTSPLLSAQGRTLLTHQKLRLFGDLDKGAEHVSTGDSVQVFLTPVGCMTVLICKDFMDAHASVESLLTEVPVDWVLVPSYGDEKTIRAHKERAKGLAIIKTGTHTVVAQTLNTALPRAAPPTECVRGFGHAAGNNTHEPQVSDTGGLVTFFLAPQPLPVLPKTPRPTLKRIK